MKTVALLFLWRAWRGFKSLFRTAFDLGIAIVWSGWFRGHLVPDASFHRHTPSRSSL
jgi:hypothetical protein